MGMINSQIDSNQNKKVMENLNKYQKKLDKEKLLPLETLRLKLCTFIAKYLNVQTWRIVHVLLNVKENYAKSIRPK